MLYHPNPSKPIYLLDDSRVQASSEFIFFVAPKERIILQRRQMKGMKVYVFQENNLIHAFSDYFAYLEQSDLILAHPRFERCSAGGHPDRRGVGGGGEEILTILRRGRIRI